MTSFFQNIYLTLQKVSEFYFTIRNQKYREKEEK
jgi:hypothetical protein